MMSKTRVSVIVLTWNGMEYLRPCLDAVLAQSYADFEVIVVDNGSTDGSADLVSEHFPQVQLIRNERNLGFAAGNNVGLRASTGKVLVLLNQDTVVELDWLTALVKSLEDYPDAGIVGGKLLDMDGQTLQHAGGYLEHPLALGQHYGHSQLDDGQYDEPRQVEFVTGAALAFKREVLSAIGDLDEGFYPGYFEDVDFCRRAQTAGYTVWYTPDAVLRHYESTSMRRDSYRGHCYYYRNRLRFVLKHYTPIQIAKQFVPAEIARLPDAPFEEVRASSLSTIEGIILWPLVAWQRRPLPTQAEYQAVVAALCTLEDTALVLGEQADRLLAVCGGSQQAPESPLKPAQSQSEEPATETPLRSKPAPSQYGVSANMPPSQPDALFEPAVPHIQRIGCDSEVAQWLSSELHLQLRRELESLNHSWQVTPRPFTSQAAILGPVIVALRDTVNNLATRWYVQALLDQQVTFNANVTRLLGTQVTEFEELVSVIGRLPEHHNQRIYDQGQNSALIAKRVADLDWQLLMLKKRVADLEEQLHAQGKNPIS